jgi:hypothetical protein
MLFREETIRRLDETNPFLDLKPRNDRKQLLMVHPILPTEPQKQVSPIPNSKSHAKGKAELMLW